MLKKTREELQAEARHIRALGGAVAYIPPSAVERWTELQLPHIVLEPLPQSGADG